jgi:hypothetical protein
MNWAFKTFCFLGLVLAASALSWWPMEASRSGGTNEQYLRGRILSRVSRLGLDADVTAQIGESLFQKICNLAVPEIVEIGRSITIPGMKFKNFDFNSFKLSEFNIDDIAIGFAAPNQLKVSLTGLSLAVPSTHFDVWTWVIFKISCGGSFTVSLTSTSMEVTLGMTNVNGKLQFASDGEAQFQWGNIHVGVDFPNFFCKVGQDIIQLFIGSISNLVKAVLEKDLPPKVGPMLATSLTNAFAKIPLTVVGPPALTSSYIQLTVDLIPSSGSVLLHHRARVRRIGAALPSRDIDVEIPAVALDNLMLWVQEGGKLNFNKSFPQFNTTLIESLFPAVYHACPGCPFNIGITALEAPTVAFADQSLVMTVNRLATDLSVQFPNGTEMPFVWLHLNMTVAVDGLMLINNTQVVTFTLSSMSVTVSVQNSAVGPIDPSVLDGLIKLLINSFLIPDFNKNFKGIALPPGLQQNVLQVSAGTGLIFGANLQL